MTPHGPSRSCPTRGIPNLEAVKELTANRMACASPVFGVGNPEAVIRNAVKRAMAMLGTTIAQLLTARGAVCAGAWPAPLSDTAARWMKFCLSVPIDDIGAWTAGTFQNLSVAETIRRLIRV